MGLKNFRLQVVFRIFILVALLLATLWSFLNSGWEVTPYVCLFLSIISVAELIRYVESTNRKFDNFLNFVLHRDFSGNISGKGQGKTFANLESTARRINKEFRDINAEKEANTLYLEFVLEHVDVALLCLDQENKVTLINKRAKQLLHMRYLRDLDALKKFSPELPDLIRSMPRNAQELINIKNADGDMELSVHATEFKLLSQSYKLISFQNIRSELEQHEIESWEKLIRVLTHEVMNSITPIVSLSGVLDKKLISEGGRSLRQLSAEEVEDVHSSISSIESRSKGLQKFVQSYRRLSAIPQPVFEIVTVQSLLDNVCSLMLPELEKRSIQVQVSGSAAGRKVEVDPQQIEQVLINLITNAEEVLAKTSNPTISIRIEPGRNDNLLLSVQDNGSGVDPENQDQLFVPFFTTKESGEGIGLALSRQLCVKNKVHLSLASSSEKGTTFVMNFRLASDE